MNPRTRRSPAALVPLPGSALSTALSASLLTALLTGLLTGLLPVGSVPTARAAEPAAATVSVLPPFPLLAVPGTPVRVRAGVRDTGVAVLRDVSVRLRVVPERLSTRDQLSRWLTGEDAREGQAVGTPVPLHGPLTPGAGASVDVEVPGAALGLAGRPFGAYGLVVEVRANVDGVVRRVALTRTALPWQERKEYRPQQLAWLVPFTGLPGASSPDEPGPGQVAAAVGPGSRLRHLLDAASAPGVSWAVDPALLTTLERVAGGVVTSAAGPSTATSGSTSAPSAAVEQSRAVVRGYLADLRAAAAGREVLELSYADPDVRALARARAGDLARAARTAAPGVVQRVLGVPARSDVGWPADGYAGNPELPTWGAAGATTLVLDPRSRPLVDVPGYTVDARVALPRSMTALMLDPSLSGLLGSVRSTDASATAAFLAHTAVATSELAGTVRRLLVAAPRNVDPDPAAFRALVASAAAVPWLEPARVSGLMEPLPRSSTADLPRRSVAAPDGPALRGVGQRDVAVVRALRRQLAAVNEVLDVPATSTVQAQRTTLELLSVAWRGHHDALVARQRALADSVGSRAAGVRVLPSTINFLANDGRLQVTVANGLNQRVQGVRLEVTVPSPKLQVVQPRSAPLTLEAGQRTGVRVPVRALASGLVTLQARLITPSGAQIGVPQELQVRLRPTDSWLVMAFGGVVGLALVFGLVRSLRRPRRRVDATAPVPQEPR
ncbi:MAG TPA: DUF6049 family protein [Actinomycetales bacterium]|nr:DUF6049 family protein [Actinomycetales bacterium]